MIKATEKISAPGAFNAKFATFDVNGAFWNVFAAKV